MSMQIGPMPIGPGQNDYSHEKVFLRQKEKAAVNFSFLPGSLNPQEKPDIKSTAADMEQISLAFNRKLKFMVDHDSSEVIVKVIDTETDKVIKILPPEELQRLHRRIRETLGFLFDQMV